jgi:hypothetical protein
MKILRYLFPVLLASLTACSTMQPKPRDSSSAKQSPETVLITYNVKAGNEAAMEDALRRAWEVYRREHLVFASPHFVVRETDKDRETRIVEVFTWVNHSAPEQVPESVKAIWNEMQALCEPRDGRGGLEAGEVELLAPKFQ